MLNAVGSDILFQLIGATGPVDLGVLELLDVKPNPKVNERTMNDGSEESEQIGLGRWSISVRRPKRSLVLERLLDDFSDPANPPSYQAVYMVTDRNTGTVGQYLLTGIRFNGFGTPVEGGVVTETAEFSADKRTKIA